MAIRSPLDPDADSQLGKWGRAVTDAEQLREKRLERRADRAADFAEQLAAELVDAARPPRLRSLDAAGDVADLPSLGLCNFANWLDPRVPPVPMVPGEMPDRAAVAVVASMNIAATSTDGGEARARLEAALRQGLEQRIGRHLSDSELAVFLSLRALAVTSRRAFGRRAQVCEVCAFVFETVRAGNICQRCQRNPPRAVRREWHEAAVPGDRRIFGAIRIVDGCVAGGHFAVRRPNTPSQTIYSVTCVGCDRVFTAQDGRSRHCGACATAARRTARSRARVSASGNSGNHGAL